MPNEIKDEPTKGKPENPAVATASSEKRGDKYQRILEAAVEVIAEHGFFNARVSDIAQRAGVADGTIYLYFKSKDQILMAAISNAFGAFLELARAEVKSASEPRDQLRRLALLHLTSLGSNRNLAIVFQTELRQSARFLARFFGSLDEMVTSWLLSERDYSLPGAADAVVDVILGGVETRRPS